MSGVGGGSCHGCQRTPCARADTRGFDETAEFDTLEMRTG